MRWEVKDCGYRSKCWVWTGGINNKGYGQITLNGRTYVAHRVVYAEQRGVIPAGMELDHLCRNPPCVNPQHMEAVTHAENTRRGINVIATQAIADEIREAQLSSGLACRAFARVHHADYGLSDGAVRDILYGRTWA